MTVLAGRLVWRWKYVGDEEPEEPPKPSPGGPGSPKLELEDICRRLHMAMGEHARVAGDRIAPFRRLVVLRMKWEGVRLGNDRTAILETSIVDGSAYAGEGRNGREREEKMEEAQDQPGENRDAR